jgi:hypothetical protein
VTDAIEAERCAWRTAHGRFIRTCERPSVVLIEHRDLTARVCEKCWGRARALGWLEVAP